MEVDVPKLNFPVPVDMKDFDKILKQLDEATAETSMKIGLDSNTRVTSVLIYPPVLGDELARIQRLAKVFGADLELSLGEKLDKALRGNFNVCDVSDYLAKRVKANTAVVPLRMKKWAKVDGYWIFLCDDWIGLENSWIDILVAKDLGFLSFVSRLYVWFFGDVVSITDWEKVPGTSLIFEMWFVGDGEHRVPLLSELAEDVVGENI